MRIRSISIGVLLIAVAWVVVRPGVAAPEKPAIGGELRAAVQPSIERGLKFLESAQAADGGWRGFESSDPAITALVVKCFAQHADYGPQHPLVRRAYDFILRYQQPDGGVYIPDQGLHNYYTSVALMALQMDKDEKTREAVARAQKYLIDLQWDESENYTPADVFYGGAGYGQGKRPDLSNTQMMLEALHDSGLSPEHPVYRKALVFVTRCQMLAEANDQEFAKGGDGGFIYSPANGGESKAGSDERGGRSVLRSYGSMTYAGFKSLLYADLPHDDPRVRAAYDWMRSHYTLAQNPNMPEDKSKEGLFYYYHVFARALRAWGEPMIVDAKGERHDWRLDLAATLGGLQRADGSWVNEADRWMESNPHLVTAYSVLALQSALE